MPKSPSKPKAVQLHNRGASFAFTLLDRYVAGLVLQGPEVKSLRLGQASLQDAFCYFDQGELWVKNMYIATYANASSVLEERRERKLLVRRQELHKLLRSKDKGMTIVPVRLFFSERGRAKLEIALAKGKKLYDKRETIKARDVARTTAQELAARRHT